MNRFNQGIKYRPTTHRELMRRVEYKDEMNVVTRIYISDFDQTTCRVCPCFDLYLPKCKPVHFKHVCISCMHASGLACIHTHVHECMHTCMPAYIDAYYIYIIRPLSLLHKGSRSRRLWESPPIPTERYERRPCLCVFVARVDGRILLLFVKNGFVVGARTLNVTAGH